MALLLQTALLQELEALRAAAAPPPLPALGAGAQPQTNPISRAIPGKPRAKRFAVGGVEEVRAAERIR